MSDTKRGNAALPVAEDKPMVRRNFGLGVINGALWMFSRALYEPETILPAFAVALMGDNPIWVGLLVSLVNAGWFWPPLVVAPALATRQRRHIYYQVSAVFRILALLVIYLLTRYLAPHHRTAAFWAIACAYLVYTSGGGVGLVPFMSVVTDSIPTDRRGLFFGLRYLFGGLLAFGAGFWVKWVLSEDSGLRFPDNYAMLFGVAALAGSVSLLVFWFAREPEHKVESRRMPLGRLLLRGLRRAWRERDFHRLLLARIGYDAGYGLVFPFLVPFAYRYLDMSEAMVGVLVAVRQLSWSMSNLLWSRISDRRGNRPLFLVSGVLALLAVLLALATLVLPPLRLGTFWGLPVELRLVVLVVAFAAAGAGSSGQAVAHSSYLLEFTPERMRPVYMGIYYLVLTPLAFMPMATALLIGEAGRYPTAFVLAAGVFVVMLALQSRLNPLRTVAPTGPTPH